MLALLARFWGWQPMTEQLRSEQRGERRGRETRAEQRGQETRAAQPTHAEQRQLVEALAEQVRQFQTARRPSAASAVSTGFAALDRALPDNSLTKGGLHRGTLVEWLAGGDGKSGCEGGGATTLALAAARQACGESGTLVVIDRRRTFYPLAAAACGIGLGRVILVRPQNDSDESWAIDQSLRSGGAAAVLAWPEKLDDHLFRRLQLAAEAGGSLGLLVRSVAVRHEPSWAEVRLLVEPLASLPSSGGVSPRRVQVEILRSPGHVPLHASQLVLSLDEGGANAKPQRTPRARREVQRRTA